MKAGSIIQIYQCLLKEYLHLKDTQEEDGGIIDKEKLGKAMEELLNTEITFKGEKA
nr:MAG TPA: hypothetical protein [Microviridae sp.]